MVCHFKQISPIVADLFIEQNKNHHFCLNKSRKLKKTRYANPYLQNHNVPLLAYTSDNNVHNLIDTAENRSVYFNLTPDKRQELLPSGHIALIITR